MPDDFGDILFVTNEIGEEEICERFDAIRFQLNYQRFMSGELNEKEEIRYTRGGKFMHSNKRRIRVIFNCATLDELYSKIRIYQPSIVFVDGSYLMEPKMEEGIVKTTFITRNLKALAKDNLIPIVNTTQLRKKTGKRGVSSMFDGQDEFYYGSYVQDSDFAIRGFQDPDMVYDMTIGLDFVKARRMARVQLAWKCDLEAMDSFGYSKMLTEEEKESKFDEEEFKFQP